MNIISFFKNQLSRWDNTLIRFPFVIAFFTITSILTTWQINTPSDSIARILMALFPFTLFVLLSYILKECYSLTTKQFIALLLLSLALSCFLWLSYPPDIQSHYSFNSSPYTFFGILFSIHLLFSFTPFLGPYSEDNFLIFNRRIFYSFVFSFLFALVMYLGVSLAVLAIEKLFDIIIWKSNIYLILFVWTLGVFHTINFLSSFPSLPYKFQKEFNEYNNGTLFLLKFILLPIVILYGLILYVYSLKIFFSRIEIQDWVSHLFIWYFITGFLGFFLSKSTLCAFKNKFIDLYIRIWPKFSLPLIAFLWYSILVQKSKFGITDIIYYQFLIAIFSLFFLLYLVIKQKPDLRIFPIFASILALFSFLGGPYNVWNFSVNDQKRIVTAELKNANLIHNNVLLVNEGFQPNEALSKSIQYLNDKDVYSFLQKYKDPAISDSSFNIMIQRLNIFQYPTSTLEIPSINYNNNFIESTQIQDYTDIIPILNSYDAVPISGLALKVNPDGTITLVQNSQIIDTFDIISSMVTPHNIAVEQNGYKLNILFTYLSAYSKGDKIRIQSINGSCLLKKLNN